jgi:hypothetical protein
MLTASFAILAALEAEAKTAKALALKAYKAAESVEITDLEDISQAQTYRANLWPSVSPAIKPALEATQRVLQAYRRDTSMTPPR